MLRNFLDDMDDIHARLRLIAPEGYSLTINIRHFTPEFYLSTYPRAWLAIYTEHRYALFDPVMVWCRFNEGQIRWSEIDMGALMGVGKHVMDHANRYGLKYGGAVSSLGASGTGVKSLASGARSDREMTAEELSEMAEILNRIVAAVGYQAGLSAAELQVLSDIALGLTHNEIADRRDISPATVKKRLERARVMLGARNAVQAVAIATKRGFILNDPTF